MASDLYKAYLENEDDSYETDREFWRAIFKNIICGNDDVDEFLQDKSIYWNDDISIIETFVLKTIKQYEEKAGSSQKLLPMALAFNLSYIGLGILLIFYIFRGFATPILKGYINQLTFSEMRATVLSIRNFIIRLMFAAIAPFVGWLNDYYSLSTALIATGIILFIPGIIFLALELSQKQN